MKRSFLLLAVLSAACGSPESEASKWRRAGKVYAEMDVAAFYASMQKAMITQGVVTIYNSPPVYKLRDGGVVIYLNEDAIPPKTSFVPLAPHQAAEAVLKQEGAAGVCVADSAGGCARKLDKAQTQALEAELKGDKTEPLTFAMSVRR